MTKLSVSLLVPAAASLLAACGDDPVSYSEPVTINLKAKSSDVADTVVTEEKGISTEQSNPYGAFIGNAQHALGGADPGSIEVDEVHLFLGADSTNVTALEEVFAGDVDVLFQMNDTNNSFPVAGFTMDGAVGAGPVALDVGFDSAGMSTADYDKLVGGGFKVLLRGNAAPDFASKGAEATLEVTFQFTAYP